MQNKQKDLFVNGSGPVAGVDIGGVRKGCHVVVLEGRYVRATAAGLTPAAVGAMCRDWRVLAVGVDAPSVWTQGQPRRAESDLARAGIRCFSTPTRERALQIPFYHWMLSGEAVYQVLAASHPLWSGEGSLQSGISFETFPHAITCALLGRQQTSAKLKREQRRAALEGQGIATDGLPSIDHLDAALCALAAHYVLAGRTHAYGDAAGGRIFVPDLAAS